jgi:hypothetical protein
MIETTPSALEPVDVTATTYEVICEAGPLLLIDEITGR